MARPAHLLVSPSLAAQIDDENCRWIHLQIRANTAQIILVNNSTDCAVIV
jgi:hypothetical protein